jgi:DNA-binding IclR family transcriptional regulator
VDLFEILADEPGPLTQKEFAERAGRPVSEIFRMLGVSERHGYLVRERLTGRYSPMLKLFVLGNRHHLRGGCRRRPCQSCRSWRKRLANPVTWSSRRKSG